MTRWELLLVFMRLNAPNMLCNFKAFHRNYLKMFRALVLVASLWCLWPRPYRSFTHMMSLCPASFLLLGSSWSPCRCSSGDIRSPQPRRDQARTHCAAWHSRPPRDHRGCLRNPSDCCPYEGGYVANNDEIEAVRLEMSYWDEETIAKKLAIEVNIDFFLEFYFFKVYYFLR